MSTGSWSDVVRTAMTCGDVPWVPSSANCASHGSCRTRSGLGTSAFSPSAARASEFAGHAVRTVRDICLSKGYGREPMLRSPAR